ncbi:MAG: two-component system heavy metal sensor histidine kinase CusS [Psychromonas sp.]|jgi:two-component system heavy metal sensor histidine kinase CusS|uniref:heavy metal sensor histidine kinase n=1 Tax=Psychromonas sp. TaxID=1884585 RepID=UPI0039E45B79
MILRRSLTLRLTCFFSIATMIVITGLSWFINNAVENHFIDQDRILLNNKTHVVKSVILAGNFNNDFSKIANEVDKHNGLIVNIKNPQTTVYSSGGIQFPSDTLLAKQLKQDDLFQWQDNQNLYRGKQFDLTLGDAEHSLLIVTIAININHHQQFLISFEKTLVKFIVLSGLLSGVFGWFVTRQGLRPLEILKEHARLVSMKDIEQRMPVEKLPIEIAGLSITLNNMLERLEHAFNRLSDFSSDIAHELRTPVNNLMTQTQVCLSQPRTVDECLAILVSNSEEFERLARMISDMLFLAKSDNELILVSAEDIALEQEIANLFEFYDALAEEREIKLKSQGQATIKGDRLMLRRAFSNLISNAMRHSLAGSDITISISTVKDIVTVAIENYGDTISPDDVPHLFDRFYRADKSRTHNKHEGVGLGLAITQSIAKMHGGDVRVCSANGRTLFSFTIKCK